MVNALISSISEKSLSNFIRSRNSTFIEYKEDLSHLVANYDQFDNLSKLGEIQYDNTDAFLVFACGYNGSLSSRSARKMQFEIAKKTLKEDFKDGAVFVFYDEIGKFRFSFIRKNYGDKEQKYSNWKRFTYFVDPVSQTNRTFKDRIGDCNFDSLENIQKAFNVEPLSIEFFDGYKAQYEKFCAFMQTDKQMQYNFREFLSDGTNKAVRDYVKKMLGRIVFLHFLQKKGWMGVPKDTNGWIDGDQNYIENLFNNSTKEQQANFLDEVLEPMFFESLNKRRDSDWYDTKTQIGIVKIPYLNGGLFEKDTLDEPDSVFPVSYFKELFQFFNQFNFTIDENEPNDADVGVDPEMLGHIFENLLEDNKDKGTFYTHKDIVHYMCQESLIEYICTVLSIELADEKDLIQVLVKYHVIDNKLHSRIKEINTALDKVKICDPAIGSGAFPMGLLHEIFIVKQTLHTFEFGNTTKFDASAVKLNIIQNSIYGVDIEKGAVDIARLRFWLSLIVDEPEPKTLPNLDYKIVVGNSLVSKLGDVIIDIDWSLNDTSQGLFGADLVRQKSELLKKISFEQKEFFNPDSDKKKLASDIRNLKIDLLINQLELMVTTNGYEQLPSGNGKSIAKQTERYLQTIAWKHSIKDLQKLKNKPDQPLHFFDWKLDFPEVLNPVIADKYGFDIVIGNPPYVRQERLGQELKEILKKRFPSVANGTADLYVYFFSVGLEILTKKGILSYITLNKYLKTRYGLELRNVLANEYDVNLIIDFFELPIFEASTDASITTIVNSKGNLETRYFPVKTLTNLNLFELTSGNYQRVVKDATEWKFIDHSQESILDKLYQSSISLKEFSADKIYRGITTGLNEAFVLDSNIAQNLLKSESKKIVKPYAQSTDIKKWGLSDENRYFLATGYDIDIRKEYPTAFTYLSQFEKALNKRQDKGRNWWNLRACKYYGDFTKPKIIYMHTAKKHEFFLDTEGCYINNSCYMIVSDSRYLFAFLNSNLFEWFKKIKFVAYGDAAESGRAKLDYNKMITVPIKNANKKQQNVFDKIVNQILSLKAKDKDTTTLEQKIDNLVYKLYELTYDEIKVIDPEFSLTKKEYEAIKLE